MCNTISLYGRARFDNSGGSHKRVDIMVKIGDKIKVEGMTGEVIDIYERDRRYMIVFEWHGSIHMFLEGDKEFEVVKDE